MNFSHLFPLHWAAWTVMKAPIGDIIVAQTPQTKVLVTDRWKGATLSNFNSVIFIVSTPSLCISLSTIVAMCASGLFKGTVISAVTVVPFSWPQLEHSTSHAFSMIQKLWYSNLIFSVTAICIRLCQSVFLARINCTANCHQILRSLWIEDLPNGK